MFSAVGPALPDLVETPSHHRSCLFIVRHAFSPDPVARSHRLCWWYSAPSSVFLYRYGIGIPCCLPEWLPVLSLFLQALSGSLVSRPAIGRRAPSSLSRADLFGARKDGTQIGSPGLNVNV